MHIVAEFDAPILDPKSQRRGNSPLDTASEIPAVVASIAHISALTMFQEQ